MSIPSDAGRPRELWAYGLVYFLTNDPPPESEFELHESIFRINSQESGVIVPIFTDVAPARMYLATASQPGHSSLIPVCFPTIETVEAALVALQFQGVANAVIDPDSHLTPLEHIDHLLAFLRASR